MLRSQVAAVLIAALLLLSSGAEAFVVQARTNTPTTMTTTTALEGMFGGLADAFKNDDALGERQNAGLKSGPNYNEQASVNGKQVPGAVVGQKLTQVANKVRVRIPVNCQQGDCGTCVVKLNGRKVKACQTSLPSGKATIQTM